MLRYCLTARKFLRNQMAELLLIKVWCSANFYVREFGASYEILHFDSAEFKIWHTCFRNSSQKLQFSFEIVAA